MREYYLFRSAAQMERDRLFKEWVAEAEREWREGLDKNAANYEPQDDFGYDDSEEFRWEHEYKRKCEAYATQVYVPTNWSDCYEREIMGRNNGWEERGER